MCRLRVGKGQDYHRRTGPETSGYSVSRVPCQGRTLDEALSKGHQRLDAVQQEIDTRRTLVAGPYSSPKLKDPSQQK